MPPNINICIFIAAAQSTAGLCSEPQGLYPHDNDCQRWVALLMFFYICLVARYYQCVHGTPQEHTCPAGLLWNQALKACDWHSNVKCSTSKSRTTTTTTTTSTTTAATATARTTTSSTTTTTTRPTTTKQCQCGVKPAKSNAVQGIVGGSEATVRC